MDVRDDPRWQLAAAEADEHFPEVHPHAEDRIRISGLTRCHEIELLYELGVPLLQPPSFRDGWRARGLKRNKPDGPMLPQWDGDRHGRFWARIVYYQLLTSFGYSPREAVAVLAASRREVQAEATARHAALLCQRHEDRHERARLGAGRYLRSLRAAVMAAGGPCTYCGALDPRTSDHIVPTSRGGVDHPTNLTIACSSCNREKRNRTPEEWKADRLAVGGSWPPLLSTATVKKAS